jgi:hypothetical protein
VPTNRRRRRQGRREALGPAWRWRLETGTWPDEVDLPGEDPHELAHVFFASAEAVEAMWHDYGPDVVAAWAAAHPGTRPWGWWRYEAEEPRRVIRGAELLKPRRKPEDWRFYWKDHRGVQAFRQWRPKAAELPLIESEAAYLRRLKLLLPGERIRAADYAPQSVDPFLVSEAELETLDPIDRRDYLSDTCIRT